MQDEQVQQIEDLLQRAEMDDSARELMRHFFNSIAEQPQFYKIVDLLNRFPALFENFCKCFILKKEFLAQGKSETEWNEFLATEDDALSKLE